MPQFRIHSIDDQRIAVYRNLPGRRLDRESGLFVVEGRLLVERLLASSFAIHSILVDERRVKQLADCSEGVPVFVADSGMLERIIGFNFHRGILACGVRQKPLVLSDLAGELREQAMAVGCVDVQDPTNLGGILRNCAAFGVQLVVVSGRGADPFARRVIRVSMGATLKLPIFETEDIRQSLLQLQDDCKFELVAAVTDAGEPLESAVRASRTAVIVGNEAQGLPEEIVQLADRRVTIPMQLQTDSLNAAVASGVLLYHFTRVAGR